MADTNGPTEAQESLVELGKRLSAALENPEALTIGTFAALVQRLHAELGMAGDATALPADTGFEQTNDDWAHLLDQRSIAGLVSQEDSDALGSFLAQA